MKKIKRKYIKKVILSLAILILLFPFIPYKLPSTLINDEGLYVDIHDTQSSGGYLVTSGREKILEYAKTLSNNDIKTDEIYINGLCPFRELDMNSLHVTRIRLYGEFTEVIKDNALTFNVKAWRPLDEFVFLHTTLTWKKVRAIFVLLFFIYFILLILFKFPVVPNILFFWYLVFFY
ncbi:hypothetical protein [Clostridium hydrogeniformans]|uniref:hypothetical protein n=1 Tax=Clostridium hydrogeniformans TaxID=349933 RepID=UPI0004840284|nr:hypothetical protein [Clostridium hydrogeniformans]